MAQEQIHETIAKAEANHFLYQYGGQHAKPGEPFTITDTTTGHIWTRNNGPSIMRLLKELNRRRKQGLPIPANRNTKSPPQPTGDDTCQSQATSPSKDKSA